MLDHYIQRNIVYRLAFAPEGLRFSELKPDELESKLFTYHLKKVVAAKFVVKTDAGHYVLTPEGRRLGTRVFEKQLSFADRPDAVLLLVIRRQSNGAWLLYRRSVHPLIGRVGFMHGTPQIECEAAEAARRTCLQKTGLDCQFSVLGSGYFKVFDGDDLESFTNFTLLTCDDAKGELKPIDQLAEYVWELQPNFADQSMLPNMATLAELYQKGQPFFIEKTFQL